MFTRSKFVTNSSSSSFLCYGVSVDDRRDFVERIWKSNILSDEDIKELVSYYGKQEYTNNNTRKIITKSLDLEDPDELTEFLDNICEGDMEDVLGSYSEDYDYIKGIGVICPRRGFYFYCAEGDIKTIYLPSQEEIDKASAKFTDFIDKLYPEGNGPKPAWVLGENYS